MSRALRSYAVLLALAASACDVEVTGIPDGSQVEADASPSGDSGPSLEPDSGRADAGPSVADTSTRSPDAEGRADAAAPEHDGAIPGPDAAVPGEDAAVAGPDAALGPDAATSGATPVWILHITDTHIGENTVAAPNDLIAFVSQVLPVVKPMFTVHTGDLTDSGATTEFSDYRAIVVGKVPDYPSFIEVIGNHDVKTNGTADFLASSLTGAAGAGPYGVTYVDLPVGRVQVARTNTSDSTSNLKNIAGVITAGQVSDLLALPPSPVPVRYSIVLAHHPYSALTGDTNMQQVVDHFKPQIYFCGHVHKWDISWQAQTLVIQGATLGKVSGTQTNFALAALDDDGPAAKNLAIDYTLTPATAWPLVLITRPGNAQLAGTNPVAAPLPAGRAGVALRAIAFAPSPVTSVQLQIDKGAWTSMAAAGQGVWATTFTAPASAGNHTLTVNASSTEGTASDSVTVVVK
jgi:predicted MPP superfamily phosphohydrolase